MVHLLWSTRCKCTHCCCMCVACPQQQVHLGVVAFVGRCVQLTPAFVDRCSTIMQDGTWAGWAL